MKKQISFLVLILFHQLIIAQIEIKGKILNNSTKSVIPYVNVGVFEKNVGTISNENGEYYIVIPNELKNDSISLSCIGYIAKKVSLNDLLNDSQVLLTEKSYQLSSINVHPKDTSIVGRFKSNGIVVLLQRKESDKSLSGGEIAMSYSNNKEIRLNQVQFLLARNSYDTVKIRVNIYDADKNKIEDKLNKRDCILTVTNQTTGMITADLKEDNIVLNKIDYMIALEIIQTSPKTGELALMAGFKPMSNRTLFRDVSFGKWRKQPLNLSLGAKVEIL